MQVIMISIIVAVSDDWGIGMNNDLLWHIPEDLKRFKKLTMGKTIIMGKRTWESLPRRPLPPVTRVLRLLGGVFRSRFGIVSLKENPCGRRGR